MRNLLTYGHYRYIIFTTHRENDARDANFLASYARIVSIERDEDWPVSLSESHLLPLAPLCARGDPIGGLRIQSVKGLQKMELAPPTERKDCARKNRHGRIASQSISLSVG
jgi:hypothetical protein